MQITKVSSYNPNFKAGAPVPYPEYTGRNSYGTGELDTLSNDPLTSIAVSVAKFLRLFSPKVTRDSEKIKQSIDNLFESDSSSQQVGQKLSIAA